MTLAKRKTATKSQQAYQDAARALGCVVCAWRIANGLQRERDGQGGATHIHHRNVGDKHGQKQLGQHAVVSMCAWHHDGVPFLFWSDDDMREVYGPSFKYGRDFRIWTADVLPDVPGWGTEVWQSVQDEMLREAGFPELVDVVRGCKAAA